MTKREIVYNYLLDAIVKKEYMAGDSLNIGQVAKECNVSDIPVREALRQLEGDGYIKITPQHKAIVNGISRDEIIQLVQVKGILEGFATRLALDYLSKEDFKKLHEMNDEMRVLATEKKGKEYSQKNVAFHSYIENRCGNPLLIQNLENMWKRWKITSQSLSSSEKRTLESCEEHEKLLKLMEERKFTEVEDFVRVHKFSSIAYWLINPY
ncbi:MAG: GntR family transcriptional regulator [Sphaerochaetaceae bacterium]|nr:GntR family transcriptional regulator [Sphaerochaetaceae bacterium]